MLEMQPSMQKALGSVASTKIIKQTDKDSLQ